MHCTRVSLQLICIYIHFSGFLLTYISGRINILLSEMYHLPLLCVGFSGLTEVYKR